jgi:hypothetical protein
MIVSMMHHKFNSYGFIVIVVVTCAIVGVSFRFINEKRVRTIQYRIARPTKNLKAIIKFYGDGLGLEKVGDFIGHSGYNGVMFGLPDHKHHLEFTQRTEDSGALPEPTKDNLLVFYFAHESEYEQANKRLQITMNITPVEPENPYWKNKSETYEDPDKWRVVLFNGSYEQ